MKSTSEYINILKQHASELQELYGITSLSLFGSVARSEQTSNSDVDVFVEMPQTMRKVCGAEIYLENLLGTHVDLVRKHNNLSDFFLKQIQRDGIRIY